MNHSNPELPIKSHPTIGYLKTTSKLLKPPENKQQINDVISLETLNDYSDISNK